MKVPMQTEYPIIILHLFASLTRKEQCNRYLWSNLMTALTELSYSKLWKVNSHNYYNLEEQVRSVEKVQVKKASWSSSLGVYGSNIKGSSYRVL